MQIFGHSTYTSTRDANLDNVKFDFFKFALYENIPDIDIPSGYIKLSFTSIA